MSAEVNQSITLFGDSVKQFFRGQQRSGMTSPLFNLPGRLVLGSYCYYEKLPQLLEELLLHASAEEIGSGMKRLCHRPNYVHLNSLALGYLVGREQARLSGVRDCNDDAATGLVMDFWARAARRYRNDGRLLPDEAGFTTPILPSGTIADLNGRLRAGLEDTLRRRIHRMVATTELYTFIFHGEARVGVFHHGPYPLDNEETLIIKELVGLREDFYPWATVQTALPCDNVAWVMRLRGVRSKIDLFGSLTTEPQDYAPAIVAEGLFTAENGAWHMLPDNDVPTLTQSAADAQLDLYRRVIDWDERYRIEYGAELYAYLLKSFAGPPGLGKPFTEKIRAVFRDSVNRHLEDLYSGREQPQVLQHIAGTKGPIFSPLRDSGVSGA